MAQLFQGWADSPSTGAYQEQEVCEVFRQAVADSIFMPYMKRVSISSGQSVTVPTRGSLAEPTTSELDEDLSLPIDKLSITSKTVDLVERGRATMWSRKAANRSPIDLLMEHRLALSEQMSLVMDTVFATAAQSGQLKYAATGAASYNLATNGSFGAAALSNANFYHLRKMRDLAFRTYLMPKLSDQSYKFIVSTAGIRGILDDPEFLAINSPQNRPIFEKNLVGRISDIDIIECNHDNALSDTVGTNSNVGEGVFLSRDAVYYAMLEMPSIHYDASHDHGRYVSLAWYGDWGAEPSNDSATAGLVRLIHFGSS